MSLIHATRAHVRGQRGQTFVEYALILAVVVVRVCLRPRGADWAMRSRRRSTPSGSCLARRPPERRERAGSDV